MYTLVHGGSLYGAVHNAVSVVILDNTTLLTKEKFLTQDFVKFKKKTIFAKRLSVKLLFWKNLFLHIIFSCVIPASWSLIDSFFST